MTKKKYVITSPNRRGGFFKKKPPEEKRTINLMTKVNAFEKTVIEENAKAVGLSVGAYVRSRCMGEKKQ